MASVIQRSFASGQIGTALYGRADQAKYATGLSVCLNTVVQRFGGVQNRSGTRYIASTRSNNYANLVKFVFNETQSYVIEIGEGALRFHQHGAPVLVSPAPAVYAGATVYGIGSLVSYLGVYYYSKVAANTGNTPSTSPTQWFAMSGTIYEVPSLYVAGDQLDVQVSQSADVMNLTHRFYQPLELKRFGQNFWTLTVKTLIPSIAAPTSLANSGAAGVVTGWTVTAIASGTYEESLATGFTNTVAVPTPGAPITVTWAAVAGAAEYNVYKYLNGVPGFIGTAIGTSFIDTGYVPNVSDTPPQNQTPFTGVGNYPAVSNYFQQRLYYACTLNNPEKTWASRAGMFNNFSIRSPLQDDDAISFTVVGRQVNEVRAILDLGKLFLMTSGSEYAANGDASGALTPFAINLRQQGTRGSSTVPPIPIENTALFVQARGSIVRDLRYDFNSDGYNGRDLTIFSPDLFDGYSIVSWDYQESPDSVVWAARDDGHLLGLTYMREQEVWAWHEHTTDGSVESVCTIPEDGIDYLYLVVRRVINGVTKRYVERMVNRDFTDIRYDAVFVDCALSYDGRNVAATTMTVTGGSTWLAGESVTMTASAGVFVAGDVGNSIVYRMDETLAALGYTAALIASLGLDRRDIVFLITAYISPTAVTVTANIPVSSLIRATATALWSKGVDDLAGLSHLEGKTVSILADGNVLPQATVTAGAITIANPATVIHVGLPYTSDIRTLDIEIVTGETLSNKRIDIKELTLLVKDTRGLYFGPDETHLVPWKQRATENWNVEIAPYTGRLTQGITAKWQDGGNVLIRQTDPLPMNILTLTRTGEVGK